MTHGAIQEQIAVIKSATAKALQSKATAEQFLRDAGIIKDKHAVSTTSMLITKR